MRNSYTEEQKQKAIERLKQTCSLDVVINELGYPSRQTLHMWAVNHEYTTGECIPQEREHKTEFQLQCDLLLDSIHGLTEEKNSLIVSNYSSKMYLQIARRYVSMCVYTYNVWNECITLLRTKSVEDAAKELNLPVKQVKKYILVNIYKRKLVSHLVGEARRLHNCRTLDEFKDCTRLNPNLIYDYLRGTNRLVG